MSEEKSHIIYTAVDIQKYFAQQLSTAEMYALEKAALDDPFLAEAMEGYEAMGANDVDPYLAVLKNNFQEQQNAKVVPLSTVKKFTMWKVAAAVLVICSGIAITFLFTGNNDGTNNTLAKTAAVQDTANTLSPQLAIPDSSTKVTLEIASAEPVKSPDKNLIAQTKPAPVMDSNFVYRPGIPEIKNAKDIAGGGYKDDEQKNNNDISSASNAAPATLNNTEKNEALAKSPAAEIIVTGYATARKKNAITTNEFIAQVVAPDNTPLPFANIKVTNNNEATYADVKGNFILKSPDSLLNISIKSVGYVARNYILKSSDKNQKIILAEDELALKDRTFITGKAKSSSPYKNAGRKPFFVQPDSSLMDVEPEDGWDDYDTYISNNLSLPTNALQPKVHGEVQVSFDVMNNGTVTNVKIAKSLCSECDKEVLRLIKEGPQWKAKKGKANTGTLKVKF